MNKLQLKSNIFLSITAVIWGFAFVAQKIGANYIGAFTFNGVRFALGGLSLIPLILYFNKEQANNTQRSGSLINALPGGIAAGCALFFAASLQQVGIAYTSAGKAAFITGLYIVLVPVIGVILKHKIHISTWIGGILAVTGLFFISVTERFTVGTGDLLELAGAVFWAVHILSIDYFTKKADVLKLSFVQFITCSILSIMAAAIFEDTTFYGLSKAMGAILFGGIFSVGIAFTLQVVGQKHSKPSHAAIILSMESVFAAIAGIFILNESLGVRGYLGCFLMLGGMLLSQAKNFRSSTS